jgi:hypothetical protein
MAVLSPASRVAYVSEASFQPGHPRPLAAHLLEQPHALLLAPGAISTTRLPHPATALQRMRGCVVESLKLGGHVLVPLSPTGKSGVQPQAAPGWGGCGAPPPPAVKQHPSQRMPWPPSALNSPCNGRPIAFARPDGDRAAERGRGGGGGGGGLSGCAAAAGARLRCWCLTAGPAFDLIEVLAPCLAAAASGGQAPLMLYVGAAAAASLAAATTSLEYVTGARQVGARRPGSAGRHRPSCGLSSMHQSRLAAAASAGAGHVRPPSQ